MDLKRFHCLLFDLDDTLYPQNNGVWEMIRVRINRYMIEVLGFPPEVVPPLRQRLWHQYGTTLRGLQLEYTVDRDHFLTYVHNIALEEVLQVNPQLDKMLDSLPLRKIIFTNANADHAHRVVKVMGVAHHFSDIIDIYAMTPHCKPEQEAFEKALALIGEAPHNCLLIDDSPANLTTASTLGMETVSVGNHHHDGSPHIGSVLDLTSLIESDPAS
jgi:putative hydrolase of the HAD superfamily